MNTSPISVNDKGNDQMSYIRIANKADGVNRLFLEKLGLSTKRDNSSTIGQFGSGSKFAPIAALRNGWQWINVGEDDLGPYRMEYVVQQECGIDCIFYKYDDEILKPSSFTVDAGVLSWDSEFQIFREAFSNALDEYIEFDNEYSIELVDEVKYEPGVFAVYLTADAKLVSVVANFDDYFSINRFPLVTFALGQKIFDSCNSSARFFYKGVLVHTDEETDLRSVFHYELNTITLNEERRVRNTYDLYGRVLNVFSNLSGADDSHVDIAKTLIRNAHNDVWEWTIPSYCVDSYFYGVDTTKAFYRAWREIHGDAIAVPSSLMKYRAQFALRNHEVVEIPNDILYKILVTCGVPCADDVLGDEVKYQFFEPDGRQLEMITNAMNIVKQHVPYYDNVVTSTKFFIPQGDQDCVYGVANMNEKCIYLSVRAFKDMTTLVGTLIHEFDHLDSGYGDEDTGFRSVADNHIGNLLIQLYGGGS